MSLRKCPHGNEGVMDVSITFPPMICTNGEPSECECKVVAPHEPALRQVLVSDDARLRLRPDVQPAANRGMPDVSRGWAGAAMTATDRRYFVAPDRHGFDGLYLAYRGAVVEFHTLAHACYLASTDHTTRGRVYERTETGTVRLVAQMATVS